MENNNKIIFENDINQYISKLIDNDEFFILNKVRLHPAEFDIVIFDSKSLCLVNIEIKRGDWKKVYQQSLRGQLYCHYSIAVVPLTLNKYIDIELFRKQGLGLLFYKIENNDLHITSGISPRLSKSINRNLKKEVYKRMYQKYGDVIYAR